MKTLTTNEKNEKVAKCYRLTRQIVEIERLEAKDKKGVA